MESPTKSMHKFSIWKLASPGSERGAKAKSNSSDVEQVIPFRAANNRPRHSAVTAPRPTNRPFSAKCVLPSGAKLSCEIKHVEPTRIVVAYKLLSDGGLVEINTRVALELDYFGFVRGTVNDSNEIGFSIAPDIIYHEMLIAKLAELHAPGAGLEDERNNLDRLTARITLRNPACVYRLVDSDAAIYRAKIALLSH